MTARSSSSPGFIDPPGNQASRLRRWATRRRIRRRTRALSRRFRLREALGELIHDIGHDDMPPRFHSDVVDVALPVPIALLCYHVAREGVMNASMHGKPQDVWVTVAQIGGDIVLRVRDNGIGFDPGTLETTPNSGIAMMLERVDTGRGALEITSSPDTGTMVTATFPLAD